MKSITEEELRGLSMSFAEKVWLAMGGSLFGLGLVRTLTTGQAYHLIAAALGPPMILGAALRYRRRVVKILTKMKNDDIKVEKVDDR